MPTTSNFGWTTPADTDLVKDGAAAIRTLGNGIDTSLVDLKGGTTGQILSKASNADLDYTWINNDQGDITEVAAGVGISGGGTSGAVTITNSMATAIDAKGDLVAGTGADAFARLAVGANNTVLTADSSTSTGLRWATPSSGGLTLLSTTSITQATTTISSISGSYKYLLIYAFNFGTSNANPTLSVTFNNSSIFQGVRIAAEANTSTSTTAIDNSALTGPFGYSGGGSASHSSVIQLWNYSNTTNEKPLMYLESFNNNGGQRTTEIYHGKLRTTSAITSVTFTWGGTAGFSGTVEIYGGN